MNTTRRYEMRQRAEAVAATRERILAAAVEACLEARSLAVTLAPIADSAGVSVQTILRQFDSRDRLLDAATQLGLSEVRAERTPTGPDRASAIIALVGHYERMGDFVIGVLGEEDDDRRARMICDLGRQEHRAWVGEVFAADLDRVRDGDRDALVDLLVVATDVYAWKLLRRDRGLSRRLVQERMLRMTRALISTH